MSGPDLSDLSTLLALAFLATGCWGETNDDSGSAAGRDAALAAVDGGTVAVDGGTVAVDGGTVAVDGGTASGCGAAPGVSGSRWTLQHGGRTREFYVHLPAAYDPALPTPVIFDFHGRGMSASNEDLLTGLSTRGTAAGFIVVQPEGTAGTWNAGPFCCGTAMDEGVDDVGFTRAMIAALEAALCVDPGGIFATGMSNGGFMAHTLGCAAADRFAAIAPVAGTMASMTCEPSQPVGVYHFHGTEDDVVPYNGYDTVLGTDSVDRAIDLWVAADGCDNTSQVFLAQDDVECRVWGGCDAGTEVRLCRIVGGGHTWPGGPDLIGVGVTTHTISATELLLDFFSAQRRR